MVTSIIPHLSKDKLVEVVTSERIPRLIGQGNTQLLTLVLGEKPDFFKTVSLKDEALDNLKFFNEVSIMEVPNEKNEFSTLADVIKHSEKGRLPFKLFSINDASPTVRHLCSYFSGLFNCYSNVNYYRSYVGSECLGAHSDYYPIITFQLDGEKAWKFEDKVIVTKKGDLLFIPPGVEHKVETISKYSDHLSISIQVERLVDLYRFLFNDPKFFSSLEKKLAENGKLEVVDGALEDAFKLIFNEMNFDKALKMYGQRAQASFPLPKPIKFSSNPYGEHEFVINYEVVKDVRFLTKNFVVETYKGTKTFKYILPRECFEKMLSGYPFNLEQLGSHKGLLSAAIVLKKEGILKGFVKQPLD